jgi:endonuclease/exonuclease/phosphatase family metal-dependent hydrolase
LTIISAHAPTEDKREEEKAEFYSKLEIICSRAPKYDLLVSMGDFNAKVGREESRHKVSASTPFTNIVMRMDLFWFSLQ